MRKEELLRPLEYKIKMSDEFLKKMFTSEKNFDKKINEILSVASEESKYKFVYLWR